MLNSLQYLRCLGVLLVLQAHLTRNFVGYFCLDIFFIVSAFVMAMLMTRPNLQGARFLKDRMTRAIPFYWSLTLLVFLIAYLFPSLVSASAGDVGNLFKSLLFIPYYNSHGILNPLLPVAWTINYEIILYGFSCLSFLLAVSQRLLFVAGAIVLVQLVSYLSQGSGAWSALYSEHYLFDFPLGLALWLAYADPQKRLVLSPRIALIVLIVSFSFMFYAEQKWSGKIIWFWIYSLPATVAIWAALCMERFINKDWLVTKFTAVIGDSSFSIYLTHVFVIQAVHLVLPRLIGDVTMSWWFTILVFVICLVVGVAVDRYYDKPLSARFRAALDSLPGLRSAPRVTQ